MLLKFIASCSAIVLLASLQASAVDEDDLLLFQLSGDEQMISIATGTPRPVSKAPAVTTVITAEQIKDSGAVSLFDVLEQIVGMHIITSSVKTQNPTFSIRGINSKQGPHTLILLNGHEITHLMTGALPGGIRLPLQSVARIEVIRGPGSAVYGADAFSGVINIITKTEADLTGTEASVKMGSFNSSVVSVQYGGIVNGWHLFASLEHRKSDGDAGRIIGSDLQSILDVAFGLSTSLAPGPMNTDFESLITNFSISKGRWSSHFTSWKGIAGAGAGIANVLDPTGFAEDLEQYLFDVSYEDKQWLPNWTLKSQFSHLYHDSYSHLTIFPAGTVLPTGADGNLDFVAPVAIVTYSDGYIGEPGRTENTTKIEVTTFYKGWSQQLVRLNIGVKKEDFQSNENKNFGLGGITAATTNIDGTLTKVTGTSLAYIKNANRTITYASVQNEWQFKSDWILTAGVRYDDYSDFGGTTNPRLSLVWNTYHDLTTKLLYGSAFRAPSFAELYAQNNPIVTGNPNIEPETIDTIELVFDYRPTATFNMVFNVFRYEIEGLIDFIDADGIPGGVSIAKNTGLQHANGFEWEANWYLSNTLRLNGSIAFQNARDGKTHKKIADAPRKMLNLKVHWQFASHWSGQLEIISIKDRPRAVSDVRDPVEDFNWINLTFSGKNIFKNIDLQIAVRNLTDTDAREPAPTVIPKDYPLEGRSVYFGITATF